MMLFVLMLLDGLPSGLLPMCYERRRRLRFRGRR